MTPTHVLAIDIETFSSENLTQTGVYKYAAAKDFEILICAYKIDDEPVRLLPLDILNRSVTAIEAFIRILQNPAYLKTAFNAPFERTCLAAYFKIYLDPAQWECTMAKAFASGLSGGLDQISQILKLGEKMKEGYGLIRYFCIPCKPTKVNAGRVRNYPTDDPAKFLKFEDYCKKDVELEYQIRKRLSGFKLTDTERKVWIADQIINDRGVRVDIDFIRNAIDFDLYQSQEILAKAKKLTGLDNPKSVLQLTKWLSEEIDEEIEGGIGATKLPAILKKTDKQIVHDVIALRQLMNKSSVTKYKGMIAGLGQGDRLRGLLQYSGASRTRRWAGRKPCQIHNLPKNDTDLMTDLDLARRLISENDYEMLDICFESIPLALSQCIRTAFIPSAGNRLLVSDFSAIEARVLAWLAGEQWRLDVFNGHGKIYEASASKMFNIPLEEITKGSTTRQKGKMSELALGYQGAAGAIQRIEISMRTPPEKRIPEKELPDIVARWRLANNNIVQFWYAMQKAAFEAVENPGFNFPVGKGISFEVKNSVLYMSLPSGGKLCYLRPRLQEGKFGLEITYEGTDQHTKKWGRISTYGGKLTENVTQAIARDLLAEAILRVEDAGYPVVLHVHDEVVCDMPLGLGSVQELNNLMSFVPEWAAGLPLGAETFETNYYKK